MNSTSQPRESLNNYLSPVRPLLLVPSQPLMEVSTSGAEKGGKKRLSVERIYQRKTQLEHILLRPDTYIGSVEESSENMWVWDEEREAIVRRQITYVPGLYKIFDEILGWLFVYRSRFTGWLSMGKRKS